jgi:UDP-4-amino-4,6-dideoxy-L-N-acetyl-beta-L-altrosamine transaminase
VCFSRSLIFNNFCIGFFMIPYSRQMIDDDDIEAVIDTLKSDYITAGPKVEEFETKLAEYVGCKYAVVCNSATSALLAAYSTLQLEEGDEIITTPISFIATTNMMLHYGAKPIFVDVYSNGNIDDTKIEAAITPKTKAIVSVDLSGNPVEYDKIKEIATKHNIAFISDSSHALGAEYKGKKVGNLADISIFSFHAIKPITTLEGGAITTDDEDVYNNIKRFVSHGSQKINLHYSDMVQMGYNLRLSDVACALGISQLKKLDTFIEKREILVSYYEDIFEDVEYFDLLQIKPYKKSSHHLYPIYLKGDLADKRDELFESLRAKGIGVQVHYRPIYKNSYYIEKFGEMSLENTEKYYKTELSIPCHQGMSMDDAIDMVDKLFDTIEEVLGIEHDYSNEEFSNKELDTDNIIEH